MYSEIVLTILLSGFNRHTVLFTFETSIPGLIIRTSPDQLRFMALKRTLRDNEANNKIYLFQNGKGYDIIINYIKFFLFNDRKDLILWVRI